MPWGHFTPAFKLAAEVNLLLQTRPLATDIQQGETPGNKPLKSLSKASCFLEYLKLDCIHIEIWGVNKGAYLESLDSI